ncbi:MAG: F0F1 ATP synthase subunit B [Chthonomonadales bacterium]
MLQELLKSLNIDPRLMLANGILFLVLLKVLDALFWKPIMRHLERRRAGIDEAYRRVEETRQEMENLRAEYQGRLAKIEADARMRIQEAVREAQRQREEAIARAREEAEQIMRDGEQDVAREVEAAMTAMRENLAVVAVGAVSKVLQKEPGPEVRTRVEEYLRQV